MIHRISKVKNLDNFIIEAVFFNGDIVQYDMSLLFDKFPVFKRFETETGLFENVKVDAGGYGVSWDDELDLNADTIWVDGVRVGTLKNNDLNYALAYSVMTARKNADITQKDLALKTGIYQAEISKLERGIGNPSISTLKRIADGLDTDLIIEFVPKTMK